MSVSLRPIDASSENWQTRAWISLWWVLKWFLQEGSSLNDALHTSSDELNLKESEQSLKLN